MADKRKSILDAIRDHYIKGLGQMADSVVVPQKLSDEELNRPIKNALPTVPRVVKTSKQKLVVR